MIMQTNMLFYERPNVGLLESVELFLDRLLPKTFQNRVDWRALKLREFIDRDPVKIRGSLDPVCKELELSLSDRHARRIFKSSAGVGVKKYARNKCLVRAARQLQTTNLAVKAIAADAGYQHPRDFARSFEQTFLLNPTAFRKMWGRI